MPQPANNVRTTPWELIEKQRRRNEAAQREGRDPSAPRTHAHVQTPQPRVINGLRGPRRDLPSSTHVQGVPHRSFDLD